MHGGAWWAPVHRVAKSQTQLSMHICHLPKPDPVISLLQTGQEYRVYSYKKVFKSLCLFFRLQCGLPSSFPSCLTPLPALCSTLSGLLPGFHTYPAFFCHRAFAHALLPAGHIRLLCLSGKLPLNSLLPLGSEIPYHRLSHVMMDCHCK